MADIKKFLDQDGVSLLWSKVVENVTAEANRAKAAEDANAGKITVLEGKVEALEAGTYDDTEVRNLIAGVDAKADGAQSAAETADGKAVAAQNAVDALTNRVSANEGALATLKGNAETEGSIDYKIAQAVAAIMENPDDTMNSINELVNWINDHADDALALSNQVTANKNDIATLNGLVGNEAVATQITNAIADALKIDGVDKYALAADLTATIGRIAAIEADYLKAADKTELINAINAKADASALDLKGDKTAVEANAQAIAALQTGKQDVIPANTYDAFGAANSALTNANAYTDTAIANIQALSEEEILAIIDENGEDDPNTPV